MKISSIVLVIIYLFLTCSSYSSGYKLKISPEQVNKLPEDNSQLITLSLVECENEDIYANFSLHQHVVIGVDYSIEYPSHVYNVPCCSNTSVNTSTSSTTTSVADDLPSDEACDKNVTIKANAIGFVELTFKDESERDNVSENFVYSVGIIRPEKQVKDDLFLYGIIVLGSISTIMFGAGLDLQKVKNYLKRPTAPIMGAACQFIVMPLLAWLLTAIINEHESIEFGLFASGVAPGGGASNAWAYLLGGDVDLSITMTIISTFAALAFIPLWMYTVGAYLAQGTPITLPFQDMATSLAYTVVPTAIGLLLNRFLPKVAKILTTIQRVYLPLYIVFIIVTSIWANIYAFRLVILNYQLLLAGMALPYFGCVIGFLLSLLFRRKLPAAITIGLESGIQSTNAPLVLLRLSLEQPWADISSAMPISLSLFTPWPLMILWMVRIAYLKFCKKKEDSKEEKSETESDVNGKYKELSDNNGEVELSEQKEEVTTVRNGNTDTDIAHRKIPVSEL